ncbi:MAG: 16S rRNA (adenine(1518)-N(6)/adenine(1519)-N(6))-dimethyltransferase RsmA [Lachnospiraceae bacterium]|nr:16S rRNA (adenine(1518)-N(6)/adenine(1519)-N(6))-dimethyltransferase RsmA [Lachnospiraceae bacterium]
MRLAAPQETLRIIGRYGLHPKKKYGQNFLISEDVVYGILDAAGVTKEDCVLEIGPGIGTMTGYLSEAAREVVCVEIDRSLAKIHEETLADCPNVTVRYEDVLKTDLQEIADSVNDGKPMKVVANLPYYVTTPILMELLKKIELFESITVMVQKEVAARVCAAPGSKDCGAITYAVQYYAEPEVMLQVPPSSFIPRPEVDSCVLRLTAYKEPPVKADEELMFALIRAAFNQRRKTLANALANGLDYHGKKISRGAAAAAITSLGLPETVRGERLSLAEFAALADRVRFDIN